MARLGIFLYGVFSYVVFLVVFLYAIGFVGGFLTPTSLDAAPSDPLWEALAIDLGLLAAFAVQHSGMARPGFKRWWTKIVAPAAERSTYVLLSSLALVALFLFWRPIGGVVWKASGMARNVMIGVYLFGWVLLLYATFLIDHFDLFGLKQVWRRLTNAPTGPSKFFTPGLHSVVRHPIYVGWMVIFWAAPTMTVAHLIFAVGTTLYMLAAIQLEERDLIAEFGSDYVEYKRRTPMLIPRLGGARGPRAVAGQ